jgi:uncharacterized protein involved in exopolysaccharide biosynthesis
LEAGILATATRSVGATNESLLRRRLKVSAVGSTVLSIRVEDSSKADAAALANAVAKAYIAIAPQYFPTGLQEQLSNNQAQEAADESRIESLYQDLKANGPTSPPGTIDQSELQNLETSLATLEANDSVLKGRIGANSPVLLQQAES